ncbi:MAG: DUF211 domain-containing protein [Halodesulfurarchaeum sp.]
MSQIRRLVLDLLKPHDPSMVEITREIAALEGIAGVNGVLVELDEDVENVKLTIEGEDIGTDAVEETVTTLGGTIHSVDQVVCGDRLVEETETPQD